jgi:GNAT superfamily N-acetyltransferase
MTVQPPGLDPITVVPATPERWLDVQEMFGAMSCWCQYWRVSAGEYGRGTASDQPAAKARGRAALRSQLERRTPPGMLAYMDGKVVGWCGIGPRHEMERLVRSRTIPKVDDRPVWSIVCFLVRVGYRRRGVARALLQGVIECAREHGVPAIEAYPVDPGGKRIDVTFAYVGTTLMFEKAGFRRELETSSRSAGLPRWLMRLELSEESSFSRPTG